MAKKNDTRFFENKLLDFVTAKDPLLEMLQWVMDKFMEIEVARKTGAPKGSHSQSRTGYRCGYRVRRFDTRLGTVYLSVPKIRQGGYIPFFVTEKKRSEQALIQVVQECWLNGVSTRKIENIAKRLGPQKDKEKVAARLRLIWSAPDEKSVRAMKAVFCQDMKRRFPKRWNALRRFLRILFSSTHLKNWIVVRFQAQRPLNGSTVKFEGSPLLSVFSLRRILI